MVTFKWVERRYLKEDYEDQLDFISDYIRVRKGKLLGKVIDVEYLKKYDNQIKTFDEQLKQIKDEVDRILPFSEMEIVREDEDENTAEEIQKTEQ